MYGKPIEQTEINQWIEKANSGMTMAEAVTYFGRSTASFHRHAKGVFSSTGGIRTGKKFILSNTQCAYLAGIIDGEGSIGFIRRNHFRTPCITITNTDKKLMDSICSVYPSGRLYSRKRIGANKRIYDWQLTKLVEVFDLLSQIEPFLVAKRDKACLIMAFCLLRLEKRPYGEREIELYNNWLELDKNKIEVDEVYGVGGHLVGETLELE